MPGIKTVEVGSGLGPPGGEAVPLFLLVHTPGGQGACIQAMAFIARAFDVGRLRIRAGRWDLTVLDPRRMAAAPASRPPQ